MVRVKMKDKPRLVLVVVGWAASSCGGVVVEQLAGDSPAADEDVLVG
jgi:hypothetical protein